MPKKILSRLSEKTKLDKKTLIVLIVGIIGVILLVLSELLPHGTQKKEKETDDQLVGDSYNTYAKDIEERLTSLISQIDGAGKTKVMVTLDCSDENVYAKEEKSEDKGDTSSYEDGFIIVKTDDGEGGVLLKVIEPKIRGVAVVCSGGNSAAVRQSIIATVTAVLDVSSARVNIATMKNDNGG